MKLNLCGDKDCCPKVITKKNGALIGEKGNLVKLKTAEWNALVDGIKKGKIGRV